MTQSFENYLVGQINLFANPYYYFIYKSLGGKEIFEELINRNTLNFTSSQCSAVYISIGLTSYDV